MTKEKISLFKVPNNRRKPRESNVFTLYSAKPSSLLEPSVLSWALPGVNSKHRVGRKPWLNLMCPFPEKKRECQEVIYLIEQILSMCEPEALSLIPDAGRFSKNYSLQCLLKSKKVKIRKKNQKSISLSWRRKCNIS